MAKLEISIGCKIDKEYEAQLDQAVAIAGKDRATFIREAVRVAMKGTIQGTDPSDSGAESTARLSFKDAAATIRWLQDCLIDFKQIAGDMQRQSAELRVLKRDDANAMHRARTEFLDGYPERIRKSQAPVHDKLTELSGKMDDLPGIAEILAAVTGIEGKVVVPLADMAEAVQENSTTVVAEARTTRTLIEKANRRRPAVFNLVITDRSWSMTFLLTWSLVTAVMGAWAVLQIASLFPPVAMHVADRFVDDDRRVCQLIERRYDRQDCLVPKDRRIELAAPAGPATGKRR